MKLDQQEAFGRSVERKKQPYEKPSVRTLRLATHEMMAVGCKLANGSFATGAPICSGVGGNNCTGAGS